MKQSEREELNRLRKKKRRIGDKARCTQALGGLLGQGSDAAVSLAAPSPTQRRCGTVSRSGVILDSGRGTSVVSQVDSWGWLTAYHYRSVDNGLAGRLQHRGSDDVRAGFGSSTHTLPARHHQAEINRHVEHRTCYAGTSLRVRSRTWREWLSLTRISVDEGKLHLASVLNLHHGECPILP